MDDKSAHHGEDFQKEYEEIELLPCTICNRSFRKNVLQRHSVLCKKNIKKRKVQFDSSKQRRQGTEMNAYLPRMKKTQDTSLGVEKPKNNWKEKHEQLIRTLKVARGEKPDDKLLVSKPIDSKTCPHCQRKFGAKSYERHVEFCGEKARRIPATPVVNQSAKERLEARIKYRVPPIIKKTTFANENEAGLKCHAPPVIKKTTSFANQNEVKIKCRAPPIIKKTTVFANGNEDRVKYRAPPIIKKTTFANENLTKKVNQPSELKKNDLSSKSQPTKCTKIVSGRKMRI